MVKPETINYRTQRAERDGLFCEKIFGPTKNFECYCGKYKSIRYKGVVCERCGVEVTRSTVRRERMGHISLAVPVTHIWFLRSTPSRLGLLLDLPVKTIEQVVYFAAYIVKSVNEDERTKALTRLEEDFKNEQKKAKEEFKQKKEALALEAKTAGAPASETKEKLATLEEESSQIIEDIAEQYHTSRDDLKSLKSGSVLSELKYRDLSLKFGHVFLAGIGAEALRDIISQIDLTAFIEQQKEELTRSTGARHKKVIKRLKFAMGLKRAEIKPEWMVLTQLPVIPPDLRPMVHLDGGRFAASDLNDLYRRVINRNNRLKRLLEIGAPEVIARNEKRMLQEAVDALLNNSARAAKAVFSAGDKRRLRSLSDMLKGKQGRFRQNLLGKRVDYSGRSVIVVGPSLKMHQCGLPKEMAMKLFKPFVIGDLIKNELAHNVKSAEKLIEWNRKEVWDALDTVLEGKWVLLNRAPTLHRLGIQAFQPVLIEGKAIQLHPLVCPAFNADFDGDQMAVHVPLSESAQAEAAELISATNNQIKPSSGEPTTSPSQDMILGLFYLTQKAGDSAPGAGMVFADVSEAINAYRSGVVSLHAPIRARCRGVLQETTVGRLIFNSFVPEELGYYNEAMGNKPLKKLMSDAMYNLPAERVARLADDFKRIGFKFATKSGLTISMEDVIIPEKKHSVVEAGNEAVRTIANQYWKGLLTAEERYLHTLKVWAAAKGDISAAIKDSIPEDNDIFMMVESGARGNWGQITQLAGMKGLVANPSGKTIELPITSSLKEGFTVLEYFTATHGGRKGKSDTALKTAEAGYLTRRLVDAVQDVIIREPDCGTDKYVTTTRKEAKEMGEDFITRVSGRTLAKDLLHPKTGAVIAPADTVIDRAITEKIESLNIDNLALKSVLTCQSVGGICQRCYGRDLSGKHTVSIGAPVGIIAAQAIGEPGTQLTMRTFHMGGVAGEGDITQGLTRVEELFEARTPKTRAVLTEVSGTVKLIKKEGKTYANIHTNGDSTDCYDIPLTFEPAVKQGDTVKAKQIIARDTKSKQTIKARHAGVVDRIEGSNLIMQHGKSMDVEYPIPPRAALKVATGDTVHAGDALTAGHFDLKHLMDLTDEYETQRYITKEVQAIYAAQGQSINSKHIEVIVRQMMSKVRVVDSGDTDAVPGDVIDRITANNTNEQMKKEGKNPMSYEKLLLGLTRVSLFTKSWLSAASFQETIRVLVDASTTKTPDELVGLKENVIIGKLIPAGNIFKKINPHLAKQSINQ